MLQRTWFIVAVCVHTVVGPRACVRASDGAPLAGSLGSPGWKMKVTEVDEDRAMVKVGESTCVGLGSTMSATLPNGTCPQMPKNKKGKVAANVTMAKIVVPNSPGSNGTPKEVCVAAFAPNTVMYTTVPQAYYASVRVGTSDWNDVCSWMCYQLGRCIGYTVSAGISVNVPSRSNRGSSISSVHQQQPLQTPPHLTAGYVTSLGLALCFARTLFILFLSSFFFSFSTFLHFVHLFFPCLIRRY